MNQREETRHPRIALLEMGHFDEGRGYQTWRANGTNDWLLIATLEGRGRFGHESGEWCSSAGDVTLIRPGVRHDYGVEAKLQRWSLLWAHFHPRPHWREWLDWPEIAPGLMNLHLPDSVEQHDIIGRLEAALKFDRGAMPRKEAFAMNALEAFFLLCDAHNPRTQSARFDNRVQKAMDYLCLHATEQITLSKLAEISVLSVSRLTHLFREQTGQTPLQYLERQRMERARQLLELTQRPVQTIAEELGFESAFYFSNRFKRQTGLSPRDYRKKIAGVKEFTVRRNQALQES